jgi:polysaccharide export outer membrane protein
LEEGTTGFWVVVSLETVYLHDLNEKFLVMRHILLFFGVCTLLLGACVPAKKLVYLQKDDLKNRKEIPKDTILRTHTLKIQEYRIQPLDLLSINFETLSDESDAFNFLSKLTPTSRVSGGGGTNNASLNGILVNTAGEIDYAVLGKIKVGGLTIFEAKDTIEAIASKYLPDVVARVRMLNFRFTVLGEVSNEQTVTSTNTRLTMMEAIGLAGGLGELADRSNVKVIRQRGSQSDIYYIDLLKEEFLESPYYYVQQNDIIVVPPLKQRTFKKYFTGNLAIGTTILSVGLFIVSLTR